MANMGNPKKTIQDFQRTGAFRMVPKDLHLQPKEFFRGIYLKITRNSNGVDNMDRMISQIYRNNMHQTGGQL
jgi:hypothetical protein